MRAGGPCAEVAAGLGSGWCAGVAPLTGLSPPAESRPHGDVLRSGNIRLVPVAELRGLRGGCGTAPAPGPARWPGPRAAGERVAGPGCGPWLWRVLVWENDPSGGWGSLLRGVRSAKAARPWGFPTCSKHLPPSYLSSLMQL